MLANAQRGYVTDLQCLKCLHFHAGCSLVLDMYSIIEFQTYNRWQFHVGCFMITDFNTFRKPKTLPLPCRLYLKIRHDILFTQILKPVFHLFSPISHSFVHNTQTLSLFLSISFYLCLPHANRSHHCVLLFSPSYLSFSRAILKLAWARSVSSGTSVHVVSLASTYCLWRRQ